MGSFFVEKLRGLADLSVAEVAALDRAIAVPRVIPRRRDLIHEGNEPGPVFVMLEGWACRYKILPDGSRQIMAFLMPGDACDFQIRLLAEMDHSIQTITDSKVSTIGRNVMEELLVHHPGIARAMHIAQLVDSATLRAWIISLGRRKAIERVAHLLLELHRRASQVGLVCHGSLALPLTQVLLADALGLTPVHTNRVLQELRTRGAVNLRQGVLEVCDAAALSEIAGFDAGYLHQSNIVAMRPRLNLGSSAGSQ